MTTTRLMEDQATKRPWEYLAGDAVIVHQDDPRGAREIAWSDADYRLIVRAVNNFDALVALARNVAATKRSDAWGNVVSEARAALTLAEAEEEA